MKRAVDPRRTSVRAAEKTSRELLRLFKQLGTEDHPRGTVLTAYRVAHQALRDIFKRQAMTMALETGDVLNSLRMNMETATSSALKQAVEIGREQAAVELGAYKVEATPVLETEILNQAQVAWMTEVNNQVTAARMTILSGGNPVLVIGDAMRGGILQPLSVIREGSRWLMVAATMAREESVVRGAERAGVGFQRQAIAAIDERTTDCCLRVHGQVVGIEEDFALAGTPRFADRLRDPPFHWYCRTSQVLIRAKDAGDELTGQMREAARAELVARAEAQSQVDELKKALADVGATPDVRDRAEDTEEITQLRIQLRQWKARVREEIHPAHARSGR